MGFLHRSLKNKFPVSWDVNLEALSHSVSPELQRKPPSAFQWYAAVLMLGLLQDE